MTRPSLTWPKVVAASIGLAAVGLAVYLVSPAIRVFFNSESPYSNRVVVRSMASELCRYQPAASTDAMSGSCRRAQLDVQYMDQASGCALEWYLHMSCVLDHARQNGSLRGSESVCGHQLVRLGQCRSSWWSKFGF